MNKSQAIINIYNVNRANRIFINSGGETCYIDAGGKRNDTPLTVDYFLLTHWHLDHCLFFTKKKTGFKHFIFPNPSNAAKTGSGLLCRLYQKKALNQRLSPTLKNGCISFLNGSAVLYGVDLNFSNATKENNRGLCAAFQETEKDIIQIIENGRAITETDGVVFFPGDADYDVVNNLSTKIRYLVVPHHGSAYSVKTSSTFLFSSGLIHFIYSTSYSLGGKKTQLSQSVLRKAAPLSVFSSTSPSGFDPIVVKYLW
jgi:hypothetical protein